MKYNIPPFQELFKKFLSVRSYHIGVNKIEIQKRTNRHTSCMGYKWGWYEIFPLDITIGYWGDEDGKDDLKDFDIKQWNEDTKQQLETALFFEHLKKASAIVQKWPIEKQNILGGKYNE